METKIETNADLYKVVLNLLEKRKKSTRTLEQYLLRLWELTESRDAELPLSLAEFVDLLDGAFDGTPASVTLPKIREVASDSELSSWTRKLANQVIDLREMDVAGTLKDEHRYFGIDSPAGSRWYNFDPHTFVECGMTGTFGGWEPECESGRQYVPGLVAYIDENGEMQSGRPEDLEEPPLPMATISWDDFADFLWSGQCYE